MRQITILDVQPADGGRVNLRAVFWLPVPSGFEVPKPNAQSIIPRDDVLKNGGVTLDEIGAIQKGAVVEESRPYTLPVSVDLDQIKALIVADYTARSDFFAQIPFKGQLFGVKYEDGSWSK